LNAAYQLTLFEKRLPKKPYYSDDLSNGLSIIAAKKAVKSRYIQHNGPTHKYWLVFDVDRLGATMCWEDTGAPAPNIVATNRENGHAHLIYGLEIPIRTAPDGSSKALRYAAAIESALGAKLGADEGYTGLICKNPLNPHWFVSTWEPNLYTLDWLADYLDLSAYNGSKRLSGNGLGRNCNLFDYLSEWAFKAIRQGYPQYDRWFEAVFTRAEAYNNREFKSPLPLSEVKATAKSVAKWTHKHMTPEGFSAWQARQGAKGGKVSKRPTKVGTKAELLPQVLSMQAQGYSNRMISEDLGIGSATISRWTSKRENE